MHHSRNIDCVGQQENSCDDDQILLILPTNAAFTYLLTYLIYSVLFMLLISLYD